MKTLDGEALALAAYQILGWKAYVYILYAESAPHSNPVLLGDIRRKYSGIGAALIAFGIKLYFKGPTDLCDCRSLFFRRRSDLHGFAR